MPPRGSIGCSPSMTWFEHRRTLDEYVLTWAKAMVLTWPEG